MPFVARPYARRIVSGSAALLLSVSGVSLSAIQPSRSAPLDQKALDASEREELPRLRLEVRKMRRELPVAACRGASPCARGNSVGQRPVSSGDRSENASGSSPP
jgi:hypothetical protein